jgi:hypothetical protein
MKLSRSKIFEDLIELLQFERSGIALVFDANGEWRLSSFHWSMLKKYLVAEALKRGKGIIAALEALRHPKSLRRQEQGLGSLLRIHHNLPEHLALLQILVRSA